MHHINLENLPANVSALSEQPNTEPFHIRGVLNIYPELAHQTLHSELPADYYDTYLMTASYSAKMQQHQAEQAAKLASICQPQASFIEIGCGDGSFLKHCSRHFSHLVGVEPSSVFAAEARQQGFTVIEKYISAENTISDERFHAFASRQVFEHLSDPEDVLNGIRKLLVPGAVGLIEVPNGLRSLLEGRFYDYFPDHIQYYSVASLVNLANKCGFVTLSCETSFGGDYLELWVKYIPRLESYSDQLAEVRHSISTTLTDKLLEWKINHKKVAIWGVGAKTQSLVPLLTKETLDGVMYAVDSDPHKHHKYIPGTDLQVAPPNTLTSNPPDVMLILALSYRTEIMLQANSLAPGISEIWTIDNQGQLVDLLLTTE